jgi:hypothetical protein
MLAMDRMQIVDEADASVKVKVLGPTTAPQPVPSR